MAVGPAERDGSRGNPRLAPEVGSQRHGLTVTDSDRQAMDANHDNTVFVVDDDPAMRRLIGGFVESAGLRCETFSSATAFLEAFDASRAGCLVADVEMPGMSGIELQETLASRGPLVPVIIVTGYGDVPLAVRATRALAVDVLEKPFHGEELLNRIDQALRINQQRRQAQAQQDELSSRLAGLTEREREVMSLVVAGCANKQIACRLHLSEKTVEAHRGHMMKKLGVVSIAELVRFAIAAGASSGAHAAI